MSTDLPSSSPVPGATVGTAEGKLDPIPPPASAPIAPATIDDRMMAMMMQMQDMMNDRLDALQRQIQTRDGQQQDDLHHPLPLIQPHHPSAPGHTPYAHMGIQPVTPSTTDRATHLRSSPSGTHHLPAMRLTDVPEFTGAVGTAVDTWIRTLDRYWMMHGDRREEEKVNFAMNRLRGAALDWSTYHAQSHDHAFDTWASMCAALRSRFRTINAAEHNRHVLYDMKQGTRTVTEYANEFLSLLDPISHTDMPAAEQRKQFIHNLRPALRSYIQSFVKPATLTDAIAAAQQREADEKRGWMGYSTSTATVPAPVNTSRYSGNSRGSAIPIDLGHVDEDPAGVRWHAEPATEQNHTAVEDRMMTALTAMEARLAAMGQQLRGQTQQRQQQQQQQQRGATTGGRRTGPLLLPRVEGLTSKQIKDRFERGECFRCGQQGHRQMDCPAGARAPNRSN